MDPIYNASILATCYKDTVPFFEIKEKEGNRFVISKAPLIFPDQYIIIHYKDTYVQECFCRTSVQIKSLFGEHVLKALERL